MTGIYEASKKHGFTDCSTEMFYADYKAWGSTPLFGLYGDVPLDRVCVILASLS